MTRRITISVPEHIDDLVEDQLEYNDSKSAWVAEAIRQRLEAEGVDTGNPRPTAAQTAD